MKDLRLEKIILFSRSQKMAKSLSFHRDLTVIIGDNQVGKSRILKSIYHAMGGNVKLGPEWERISPQVILFANLNGKAIQFMRSGKSFAVFNGESKSRLIKTSSVTNELAPVIAKLFDFHLKLTDANGKTITPTPAFLFMPYYIDQGDGWGKLRKSFQGLGQFPKSDQPTIEYHLGIRGSEYYMAKGEREETQNAMSLIDMEIKVTRSAISKLSKRLGSALMPIDYDKYNQETSELIVKIAEFTKKADKLRSLLGRDKEILTSLWHQRKILESTIKELRADEKTILKLPDVVECPICGHEHENDFSERFNIARDQDKCRELLDDIIIQIDQYEKAIKTKELEHADMKKESELLRELMNVKRAEFSMRELVENAGERRAMELLKDEISAHERDLDEKTRKIKELALKMDRLTNREKVKEINAYLRQRIADLSLEIGARNPYKFKGSLASLNSEGSELPRQILAAAIGYIDAIEKYGDPKRLPVVIDSPLQQEQDDKNVQGILKFLSTKRIESQVILGTVATGGIAFPGSVIEIKNPRNQLLSSDGYKENESIIDEYMDAFVAKDAES